MEKEKRKVGDYTVLCSVNIGSREIILAENEQSTNGERFLCCYGERDDIFEKFTECAVGDDYIDAALFFAERIKQDAERFRAEMEKLDIGLNAQIPFKRCGSFVMCAANTVALTIRFGRSPRMCDCQNRIVEEVSENEYD